MGAHPDRLPASFGAGSSDCGRARSILATRLGQVVSRIFPAFCIRRNPMTWKTIQVWLGRLAAVALLWWLGRSAVREWHAVAALHRTVEWRLLLVGAFFVGLALVQVSTAWGAVLRWLGGTVSFVQSFVIVNVSALGRYVPGKVWVLVGKIGFLQRLGVPSRLGVKSLLWEAGFASLTAGLWCVPGLGAPHPLWAIGWISVTGIGGLIGWGMWRTGASGALHIIALVGRYVGLWILFGFGLFMVGQAVVPVPMRDLLPAIRAYALAHMASVLVVWVPNGIGVREWCLHWLLEGTALQPVAGVVAFAMRGITTCLELTYAALGSAVCRRVMTPRPVGSHATLTVVTEEVAATGS